MRTKKYSNTYAAVTAVFPPLVVGQPLKEPSMAANTPSLYLAAR